jgi:hypothetical protein
MPEAPAAILHPPAGEVQVIRWDPLEHVLRVDARESAALKLRTYNFPGWKALVDGQPTEIENDASGAQVVNILPGQHTVEVYFVNTPPRILGSALSGAGVLLICGLVGLDLTRRRRLSPKAEVKPESKLEEKRHAGREIPGDAESSSSLEG